MKVPLNRTILAILDTAVKLECDLSETAIRIHETRTKDGAFSHLAPRAEAFYGAIALFTDRIKADPSLVQALHQLAGVVTKALDSAERPSVSYDMPNVPPPS